MDYANKIIITLILTILPVLNNVYPESTNNTPNYYSWLIKPINIQTTDFKPAFKQIEMWEGGFSNDPGDAGQMTYCGISRKSHPKWSGWNFIDQRNPKWNQIYPELTEQVKSFYYERYWIKPRFNETGSQELSEKLFNISVHFGQDKAVRMLKQAVKRVYCIELSKSRIIDDELLVFIYGIEDKKAVLDTLNSIQKENYLAIVKNNFDKRKYLKSWLRRVY